MNIKHSKIRNTGVLFELLIRTITADALSGIDSKAIPILKKYFTKTELGKEYKLYETIINNKNLTSDKANMVIDAVINSANHLNKSSLKRQKYNLVKEIKEHYNLDEFFKTKLPNYKIYASVYTLLEIYTSGDLSNSKQVIDNKNIILEHIQNNINIKPNDNDIILEEFKTYDRGLRNLTYKFMLDKFNERYEGFNDKQKLILKEFINSVDNGTKLKDFYNEQVREIKIEITTLNKKTKDKVTNIKINETINILQELDKNTKVKNDDFVALLQYHGLIEELKIANNA